MKPFVTDELWEIVAPLLPRRRPHRKGGRPWVDDRATLNGILYVLRGGMPWRMLPTELGYGSGVTCWRRLREWQRRGVWRRLHQAMLASRPLAGSRADHDYLTFNRVPAAERGALFDRLVPESGRVARELSLGTVAVDAGRVRCPVLAVSARDDRFVPPAVVGRIARKYGAPHLVAEGHGHFLVWEPGWEGPAGEIERWIAQEAAPA